MPEMRNYMEVCVQEMTDTMINKMGSCTCENCRYDIMAIALNILPSKYVVTSKGQLYTKINSLQRQFEVDIISAVTRAIAIVNASPRHDEESND